MLSLGACGDDPPPAEEIPAVPNPATGVVTHVESEGIGNVTGFTLMTSGRSYEFNIDPDLDYGFDLDHLNEHRVSAEPVVVEHEERDGSLVALSIEDA